MSTPIGAELGRVALPSRGEPFDDVRLAMVDTIIAAKAADQLDQPAWQAAFDSAMRSIRLRVVAEAESALRAAAARSRYPRRRIRNLLPDAAAADGFLQRLLAAGMPLEQFEGFADDPVTRRARGAALEASWEAARAVAAEERSRWSAAAARIAAWKRPVPTLWAITATVAIVALLIAGWLSGMVASPHWFRPFNDFWWTLWP